MEIKLNKKLWYKLMKNDFNCLCAIEETPCMCRNMRDNYKCKCGVFIIKDD